MRLNILIFIFSLIPFKDMKGQESNFYIKQISYKVDFDKINIDDIDSIPIDSLSINKFNLIEGKYTIYFFERKILGKSKDDINLPIKYDLIIIKVDNEKLIESYYFPLSWREPPISNVILNSKKGIKISKKLSTDSIGFVPIKDEGINILQKGCLIFSPQN